LGIPVWVTIAAFVVFGVLLNQTAFGKNVLAIGGNAEAARLAGVAVERIRIAVFTLQGLLTGFAGVLLASRMSLGDPKTSVGLELGVISACVLGG
ncbi:ribose ABC transporter permease, partial [Acinetobacter baumannii]